MQHVYYLNPGLRQGRVGRSPSRFALRSCPNLSLRTAEGALTTLHEAKRAEAVQLGAPAFTVYPPLSRDCAPAPTVAMELQRKEYPALLVSCTHARR